MVSRRAVIGMAGAALSGQRDNRPNLLVILTDGWRGQALPMAGDSNLRFPNIERLAREGVYCSRVYTSYPVCCPSRAAVLTGKVPHAAGVTGNHQLLPLEQSTMSAAMKAAGYRTGYIGKWHLDGSATPGFVPRERRRGFDDWSAFNVAHRHYDWAYFRDDPIPVRVSGFEADTQTDLALDFMRKDKGRPFYLCVSILPPHAPLTPPARHNTFEPAALRLRPNVPKQHEATARKALAGYYGLCAAADENLGRLLDELDATGLVKDTIVVFTSDHGQTLWSHGVDEIDLPFEESARIPLIVRYPRVVPAGATYAGLISNIDFAPTLMALCGVPALRGVHGSNQARRLAGVAAPAAGSIYCEGALHDPNEWRMVVQGRYKLVVDASNRPTHLFDLVGDAYEQENLAGQPGSAAITEQLQAVRRRWASRTADRGG